MKSHAKASSAGSTEGRGASQGSFVRGADATRGLFGDSDGSGAPSRRRGRIALSLFAALLALAVLAATALASKDLTTYIGGISGSGAKGGEFNNPRDVAVNESGVGPAGPGDTYVADEANNRIERFSSTGTFISAWGANATHRDEVQKLVVNANSGSFTLSFEGDSTTSLPYNVSSLTVDDALDVLPGIGGDANVNVSSSGFGGTQTYTITFTGALTGTNVGQLTADASELEGTAEVTTTENGSGGQGSDYEICTVAGKCGQALASGGNTTATGNGTLSAPQSLAVDEDTGNVYVSDRGNRRVDEYDGEGAFIRSFGFDVAESGPGNTGTAYEVCNQAEGDVCKAGVGASSPGAGQFHTSNTSNGYGIAVSPPDGEATIGSVFLANSGARRVETFNLDGSSPANFGSSTQFGSEQPRAVAVDSRGIVYASDSNKGGDVQRYDTEDANGGGVGFLAPILPPNDEVQKVSFSGFATGDKYELTCPDGIPTAELAYVTGTNGLAVIQNGLEEACGAGNVSASGNPPNTTVTFTGDLGGSNQPSMTCTKLTGAGSCSVSTTADGNEGPLLRGEASSATAGLAVDPAEDVLYVLRDPSSGNTVVQQFGPANEPGLLAAPTEADDTHGAEAGLSSVRGLGLNGAAGKLYVSATSEVGGLGSAHRVYALGEESSLSSPSAAMTVTPAARSATFTGSVNPNGGVVDCRFQYSTDEAHWTDVGNAKGTGQLHNQIGEQQTVTSVTTTEGAFAVGQTITSSDGGIPPGTKITKVDSAANTISVGNFVTTAGSVTLTAVGPSPCQTLTPGGGSQSISQEVPALAPDAEYFARLRVSRPFFPGLAPVTSSVQGFTTDPAAPLLSEAAAKSLDDSSVRVSAKIDPAHSPTVYVVQYGTTPALGSSSAPIQVGEGSVPVEASTVIHGLKASTAYYFKVVASNVTGSASSAALKTTTFPAPSAFGACPNDLLRTGPSAKLPDCRAYEQVTPTDKSGSDVSGSEYSVQASPSGDGISFYALAGFPGSEGFQNLLVLLSHFSAGQWSTAGMQTPPSYGDGSTLQAWTSDLRLSFLKTRSGGSGSSLVMRDNASGAFTIIVPQGAGFDEFELAGASADDSKVFFAATGAVPVTSGPAAVYSKAPGNVYLYDRETGELTLAGVLPDSACGTPPCVPAEGSEAPGLPGPLVGPYVQDGHPVSSGGDVYFTDVASKQLYLRREAASPGASTVPVSASERTDCADNDPCAGTPEPDPAGTFTPTFAGATPDGAHAFFTSEEELTDDATTATGAEDLYRFAPGAPAGHRLTDLAPGAEVRGVLGYSDDGSYVYFAANADLDGAGPASAGNCSGTGFGDLGHTIPFQGKCSLYLWHDGEFSFVARLDTTVMGEGGGLNSDGANWRGGSAEQKTSRVSADGKTLLFRSQRELTGYDNQGTSEFYRYEAGSGQIECLTCDPSGAAPTSWPELKNPSLYHAPSSGPNFTAQPFLSRNLSADGKRFFFQTPDKLVPADVNGDVSCPLGYLGVDPATGRGWPCLDVYEWEAPGKGSCTTTSGAYVPSNGGCIYLLSTGTGAYPSYLADVSQSGDTAFIFSRQQLVPSFDEDNLEDIYAVKVNGGLAYQHAVRPAACEGDACRGAASQPSSAPGAGTAAFEGPGDPKQGTNKTRCPKGKRQVRRKGKLRCVAKHAKHRRHTKHKRHHKRAANHNRRASR